MTDNCNLVDTAFSKIGEIIWQTQENADTTFVIARLAMMNLFAATIAEKQANRTYRRSLAIAVALVVVSS